MRSQVVLLVHTLPNEGIQKGILFNVLNNIPTRVLFVFLFSLFNKRLPLFKKKIFFCSIIMCLVFFIIFKVLLLKKKKKRKQEYLSFVTHSFMISLFRLCAIITPLSSFHDWVSHDHYNHQRFVLKKMFFFAFFFCLWKEIFNGIVFLQMMTFYWSLNSPSCSLVLYFVFIEFFLIKKKCKVLTANCVMIWHDFQKRRRRAE